MISPSQRQTNGIVSVMAALQVLFCTGALASATAPAPESITLEPILVSAVRTAISGQRLAQSTRVIPAATIRRMTARSLADVLAASGSADVSSGNGLGPATSLSIHGSNARDILVMVDDIPFNTQLSGQANPTRIPAGFAKRVEVLKGAVSSAWGSGLGGAVNVITKDTGDSPVPKGQVTTTYGQFRTAAQSVELAGKAAAVGYYLFNSLMTTRGTPAPSSVNEQKSFGKLSTPVGDRGLVTAAFGYSGARVEERVLSTNRFYQTPYISRYGKLALDLNLPDTDISMSLKMNNQDTGGDAYNAATGIRLFSSYSNNKYIGTSLRSATRLREDDLLVLGGDLEWDTIKSRNYLSSAKSIAIQAPYANYTWRAGPWDVIPGLRWDNNNRFGNQVSPSLGAVRHFSSLNPSQWRIRMSRAFNAPPLMWIYNDDPLFLAMPNPDLSAEHGLIYETGVTAASGPWQADLDLYRSDIRQGIALAQVGGLYQQRNISKIRRQGAEARLNWIASGDLTLTVTAAAHHPVNRATRHAIRGNGVALRSLGWGADWSFAPRWNASLFGHWERWDSAPDQANDQKPILDSRLSRSWAMFEDRISLEVFLDIFNLTNSKYWRDPTKPLPGRYFQGGVNVEF